MNYLLTGPEKYLKRQFLEQIKKTVLGPCSAGSNPDFGIFDSGTASVSEILTFLGTMPFISKKRLVFLRDIDKISPTGKESIIKYLKFPRESSVLVMETSSPESWKYEEKTLLPAKIIRCGKLNEHEIHSWIKNRFDRAGKKISAPALALMTELTGGNLMLLENEISKMISFVSANTGIDERHVEELCGRSAYKTAFELVDLIIAKKFGEALLLTRDLASAERPYRVLNLLAWQFRNFTIIKNLPKGISREAILRSVKINKRFLEKTLRESRRFTRAQLARNLEVILEADFSIKTGKFPPQHAMERALAGLCAG